MLRIHSKCCPCHWLRCTVKANCFSQFPCWFQSGSLTIWQRHCSASFACYALIETVHPKLKKGQWVILEYHKDHLIIFTCEHCRFSGESADSLVWTFSWVAVHTGISQQETFCRSCSFPSGNVREGLQGYGCPEDVMQKLHCGNRCIFLNNKLIVYSQQWSKRKAAYRSVQRTNCHQHAGIFADTFIQCLTCWCSGGLNRVWEGNLSKKSTTRQIFEFSHTTTSEYHKITF